MASDQGLYAYAGERLLAGDAPYAGAWDQKPPGIHVVYAVIWTIWPSESAVAGADMAVAGLVAWLLIVIGRRRFTETVGMASAAVFLLYGNPSLAQRMSGVFVRAQCETFIALAVAAAMALMASHARSRRHLIGAGVLLGAAFWLKYNAAAYALPVAAALWLWPRDGRWSAATGVRELVWVAGAGALTVIVPLIVMGLQGALGDLQLATIAYNLAYSGDSYQQRGPAEYLFYFLRDRAANDALWFVGALGGVAIVVRGIVMRRGTGSAALIVVWMAAVVLSIVVNGARHLPQYFVQAGPVLALLAAVGLAPLLAWTRQRHAILAALLLITIAYGAHRVSGLEDLIANTRQDWAALTGVTDRATYLTRFGGRPQDKFVAGAIAELATLLRETTPPDRPVYVFGYSPGALVLADRRSASRFHWSQPVMLEFASDRPGYGSAGLLADLQQHAPTVVALQYDSWGPAGQHSAEFFHATASLDQWLTTHYVREPDLSRFEIWRRR